MAGGLLHTETPTRSKLYAAIAAEFLGSFLFAFLGGAAGSAAANGLTLAALIYATANVSGGHLNPAVTISTVMTGHTSGSRAIFYVTAQVVGAILAAVMHRLLLPSAEWHVGCFAPHELSLAQAAGWEAIMTFFLVVTIYSVAVGEPSFGIIGPLAIGLALYAAALAGGHLTGAALNPARVLGPAVVFGCSWNAVPVYIGAQLVGGALAALASWPLYGTGLQLGHWWDDMGGAMRSGYQRMEAAATSSHA